jgi:hypothetical protein
VVLTRTVAGREFELDKERVEHAVADVLPDPLRDHYVVIGGRRFPPKQVLSCVTGLDRADFTTHQARRILQRVGFPVGRVADSSGTSPVDASFPHQGAEAAALRAFRGQWVAQDGLQVLVAAESPQRVLEWLNRHGKSDAVIFRVPHDETEADAVQLR